MEQYKLTNKIGDELQTEILECGICLKYFYHKNDIINHVCKNAGEKQNICSKCEIEFQNASLLKSHRLSKHSGRTYQCNVCDKTYKNRKYFHTHINIHKGTKFTCGFCSKTFSAKHSLNTHMKLHANKNGSLDKKINYLSCLVCQKLLLSQECLQLHMQVHNGTQKYQCHFCNSHFSRKSELDRHLTIHTGEKPYKCKECPKAFRQPGDLGRHKRWHSGETACHYCGKRYARKDELLRHILQHESENHSTSDSTIGNKVIGNCNVQNSMKQSEDCLEMLNNDDTSPKFECSICKKFLTSEYHLENHVAFHIRTNISGYKCHICGRFFSTSSNRARHISTMHSRSTLIYTCDTCTKTFKCERYLKDHIWAAHRT